MTGVLKEEEIWIHRDTRAACGRRRDHVRTEKMAVFETRRQASQETTPAGSLNMDFQSLELTENKFLLLSHQACGILLRKPRQTNSQIWLEHDMAELTGDASLENMGERDSRTRHTDSSTGRL